MDRITVTERQLASAISVWLGRMPKKVWEELAEHKLLSLYKRQNQAPRLDAEIGAHIAAELAKAKWEVSYPVPTPIVDLRSSGTNQTG